MSNVPDKECLAVYKMYASTHMHIITHTHIIIHLLQSVTSFVSLIMTLHHYTVFAILMAIDVAVYTVTITYTA